MSGVSVKNEEEALFTDKKKYRFKGHSGAGSKGDIDKLRDHQRKGSS